MKYNIQIISRIKTEESNVPILMEIELKNNIVEEKNKKYFKMEIEKISYIEAPKEIYFFNPLSSSGEMLIEVDRNNKMINLINYEKIKERITNYYEKLISMLKKEDLELKQKIREISALTYRDKENAELEILKTRYLYAFLGGNFQNNVTENTSLEGFLKNTSIPVIYKKENINNTTHITGKINEKKISAYSMMKEMENFGLAYDKKNIFFKSEFEINHNYLGEIKNAKIFFYGGIIDKFERKELITINQIEE